MSAIRYRPYLQMKHSGEKWLGEIPVHWDCLNGKRLFRSIKKSAYYSDEQLAASQKYGVVPQSLMMQLNDAKVMLALKGTESFRHVERDNFVISLRSFEGGIEHSNYVGCVSPAYTVLEPVEGLVKPTYYRYLLKSNPYISALQASTDSLRDGKSISYDQFGRIQLPVPELTEQLDIARFLDHETAKIDTLIEKQQQLIKLLKEKRKAVTSHAVTKGLNPDAPMKDSGVEWLGVVPEHWKLAKLGHYAQILTGFPFRSASFSHDESDVRLLRGASIGVGALKWDDPVYWKLSQGDDLSSYLMAEGQIVLGMDRPWVSEGIRLARVKSNDLPCLLLQRVAAISPDICLKADYLFLLLSTDIFKSYVEPDLTGVSVPHISPEQILNFQIPLPDVEEQEVISGCVHVQLGKISELLLRADRSIELLKERRTALISAAVTGKIDVRNFKADDANVA